MDTSAPIHGRFLTQEEERELLRIARDALFTWIDQRRIIELHQYEITKNLAANHGAFVTIHQRGKLRGCIGSILNTRPLITNVRDNAINAASRDPRFPPITPNNSTKLSIEVSALLAGDTPDTPFCRIQGPQDIVIGRDGLYICGPGQRTGILLPQVAPSRNWNAVEFLEATCLKAGFDSESWRRDDLELFRFSAQVFAETNTCSQNRISLPHSAHKRP